MKLRLWPFLVGHNASRVFRISKRYSFWNHRVSRCRTAQTIEFIVWRFKRYGVQAYCTVSKANGLGPPVPRHLTLFRPFRIDRYSELIFLSHRRAPTPSDRVQREKKRAFLRERTAADGWMTTRTAVGWETKKKNKQPKKNCTNEDRPR